MSGAPGGPTNIDSRDQGRTVLTRRATELLRQMLGEQARFRDGQLEAILRTVHGRGRTLLVQRTGWGKSLVYFIATRLLREAGLGPALLISPLLSLMRNQIEAAARIGVRAQRIDSENPDDWPAIERQLRANAIDALLVSPERLANERFLTRTIAAMTSGAPRRATTPSTIDLLDANRSPRIPIGLLVVDEAHCISDWGHDFRPDYRRIARLVSRLPEDVPVLATTATANDRVAVDVQAQLAPDLQILRGPLTRESLHLQSVRLADAAERLAWLADHVPHLPGSGIIYCLTTADCDRVSRWLGENGIDAPAYHAKLARERPETVPHRGTRSIAAREPTREMLEQRLLDNRVKALVATVALGMGFDKPDLGFVVHYQRPGSIVSYYQQIGRAGRSLPIAYAVLLNGREDEQIQEYFIETAFPDAYEMRMVLEAIQRAGTIRLGELHEAMTLSWPRLQQCLRFLEVEHAIQRDRAFYRRTSHAWTPDEDRSRRVTALRRAELDEMRRFAMSETCLMAFIARALDDRSAAPCGRCAVCRGKLVSASVNPARVRAAREYLDRLARPEEPRDSRFGRQRARRPQRPGLD